MHLEHYQSTVENGVTILIGPRGGRYAPALRHYNQPLDVQSVATLFRQQQESDSRVANPRNFRTGHFGPIVDTTRWKCNSDQCPCQRGEDLAQRLYRSFGRRV
jgi:hypothetical protein